MTNSYHNIFFPLLDVYRLGGLVWENLSAHEDRCNLVVVPSTLVDLLQTAKEERFSGGIPKALAGLKDLPKTERISSTLEGVSLYRVSDNLHIASVRSPFEPSQGDIAGLVKKIMDSFPSEKKQPRVLTTVERHHLALSDLGLCVEDPDFLLEGPDIVQEGIIEGSQRLLELLYENSLKSSSPFRKKVYACDLEQAAEILGRDLYVHQFVRFGNDQFARVTGDYAWNREHDRIVDVKNLRLQLLDESEKGRKMHVAGQERDDIWGIKPLDMEQYLTLQYGLLNPDVQIVFVCGEAGSGKTILSYAAAIDQILCTKDQEESTKTSVKINPGLYRRAMLLKAMDLLGGTHRELGFLPGNLWEKVRRHLKPYHDAHNLTTLGHLIEFSQMFAHPRFKNEVAESRISAQITPNVFLPPDCEAIELEHSGYLRGRSIHDTIMIIDEAQNYTPYEMQGILTRLGPGSKIIVVGDPNQTDNPHCRPDLNGLTYAVKHFFPRPYCALFPLPRSHRHQIAEDAISMPRVYL